MKKICLALAVFIFSGGFPVSANADSCPQLLNFWGASHIDYYDNSDSSVNLYIKNFATIGGGKKLSELSSNDIDLLMKQYEACLDTSGKSFFSDSERDGHLKQKRGMWMSLVADKENIRRVEDENFKSANTKIKLDDFIKRGSDLLKKDEKSVSSEDVESLVAECVGLKSEGYSRKDVDNLCSAIYAVDKKISYDEVYKDIKNEITSNPVTSKRKKELEREIWQAFSNMEKYILQSGDFWNYIRPTEDKYRTKSKALADEIAEKNRLYCEDYISQYCEKQISAIDSDLVNLNYAVPEIGWAPMKYLLCGTVATGNFKSFKKGGMFSSDKYTLELANNTFYFMLQYFHKDTKVALAGSAAKGPDAVPALVLLEVKSVDGRTFTLENDRNLAWALYRLDATLRSTLPECP